jgi:hypothetical protein
MSETPRTDSEKTLLPLTSGEWLSVHFARELERELNAAKAEAALARVENERVRSDIDRIRVEVEQRTAERDEARRELCIEHLSPEAEARRRDWNCFDAPHANASEVRVQNGGAA